MVATLRKPKPPLTAADLLRMDAEGKRGELIRGVFRETMPPGKMHAYVASKLGFLLQIFVFPRRLGVVATSEIGVWLETGPDTVRAPDIAFFSAEQDPPGAEIPAGYSRNVPALAVEVASPSDSRPALHDKALMWLNAGARMAWNVHPDTRTVDVYRPNLATITLAEGDVLSGYDVIPGFSCQAAEIFEIYADAAE